MNALSRSKKPSLLVSIFTSGFNFQGLSLSPNVLPFSFLHLPPSSVTTQARSSLRISSDGPRLSRSATATLSGSTSAIQPGGDLFLGTAIPSPSRPICYVPREVYGLWSSFSILVVADSPSLFLSAHLWRAPEA
ncbi:hypothetical protein BT93_D1308 [Corymbia citriodora subsp. variegata]|nr:hypothetical protein BT93_D1308 [Corymbia citriodora subsp. variegata]